MTNEELSNAIQQIYNDTITTYSKELLESLNSIKELLQTKNASYGDSALDPIRCFSQSSIDEQINVRIDDKISRLIRGKEHKDEDTYKDLVGYFVIKYISKNRKSCDKNSS